MVPMAVTSYNDSCVVREDGKQAFGIDYCGKIGYLSCIFQALPLRSLPPHHLQLNQILRCQQLRQRIGNA